MANRYWVGGTADWNATAGTKWSLTSGGAGGEAVPTSADDVFLDANSGAVTISVGVSTSYTAVCKNFNCTGFTGTLTMQGYNGPFNPRSTFHVYGSFTLSSTMTISNDAFGADLVFKATTTGNTITSAGKIIQDSWSSDGLVDFDGVGGEWIFQDDTTINCILTNGAIDTNGKTITFTEGFGSTGATARTITLGASTLIFTGANIGILGFDLSGTTNLTFDAGTSTIKFINTSGGNTNFKGGGLTYNTVWFDRGSSTGTCTITGSNTINQLKISPGSSTPVTLLFTAGTTQTITSLICLGNNVRNVFKSTSNGNAWNLSCASGTIAVTNASLQDSAAAGGATFLAYGTTNVSGNSGWSFSNLSGFFGFY